MEALSGGVSERDGWFAVVPARNGKGVQRWEEHGFE